MPPLQFSNWDEADHPNQSHPDNQDGEATNVSEEFTIQSIGLVKRVEIWVGRLAMFSLTAMATQILINSH
jgi:hypothetical protein